jgi:hypothetical protein
MKITASKIKSFARGHSNLLLRRLGLYPKHKQEQILYRISVCKDECVTTGKCINCGCPTYEKMHDPISCNGERRFPDMMDSNIWEQYKLNNNIIINND